MRKKVEKHNGDHFLRYYENEYREKDGVYEEYLYGVIRKKCVYKRGKLNGPCVEYKQDDYSGQIVWSIRSFYQDDREVVSESRGRNYIHKEDKLGPFWCEEFLSHNGEVTHSPGGSVYSYQDAMDSFEERGLGLFWRNSDAFFEQEFQKAEQGINNPPKNGLHTEYDDSGKLVEKYTMRNGQKNGLYESYWPNGVLRMKCYYVNNQRHGPAEQYGFDGKLMEKYTFKNGEIDGLYEEYHSNGRLRVRCEYKDGKHVDGPHKEYHDNGQLWISRHYKNGEQNGPFEIFFSNGRLNEKGTYKNDKLDGPYQSYYGNGQTDTKCTFKEGTHVGLYESYHDNGQLFQKCNYNNNGEWDGPFEKYYREGGVWKKGTYVNGKFINGEDAYQSALAKQEKLNASEKKEPQSTLTEQDSASLTTKLKELQEANTKLQAENRALHEKLAQSMNKR